MTTKKSRRTEYKTKKPPKLFSVVFLMILNIAAAFAVAVLSGLGVGGGGLFILYLTLITGVPQLGAQGINLIFFICASLASLLLHGRKRKIKWRKVAFMSVFGAAGAVAGSLAAAALDPYIIKICFGILMTVSGLILIFRRQTRK